ncbi:four helix bundle protein [Candidatus Curtissbacteria bacterium]|nr:four helix bundle protein [Candidatus Curtissbacteria bacterium]
MTEKSEKFKNRLVQLTVNIINQLKKLNKTSENLIFLKQIIRSSSSVGANYQESQHAHSKKEFIQKLNISLKESSETIYWLELIEAVNKINLNTIKSEAIEIRKILTSIIKTTKLNLKSEI